jgi:carboxylesterase type B
MRDVTYDATFGDVIRCTQRDGQGDFVGDENCLYLNVYAPQVGGGGGDQ